MSQDSVFHNGLQIGDATNYSAEAFHKILSHIFLGQTGYVVPGASSTLNVTFSAGQTVSIAVGSAFVAGVYYNNSAALSIVLEDNPGGTNRIDRIIIRVDWAAQTARIVAKRGTASSTPVVPALQQDIGDIYEVSLAAVVITPAFVGFGDEFIYDERQYLLMPGEDMGIKNIMFNSEFMSGPGGAFSTVPFPMWRTTGTPSISYFKSGAAKFDTQARGRSLLIIFGAGDDFYTYVRVNNGALVQTTLAFIIQVTSGGPVDFSMDGGVTTTYTIPRTQNPVVIFARMFNGSSGGNQAIEPHFSSSVSSTFKLGQMTIAFGNNAAPFEPNQELVLQPAPFSLASSALGDNGLKIYSLSQDVLWQGVKNAVVQQYVIDTGSAAQDAVYARLWNNYDSTTDADIVGTEIGRLTNNIRRYGHGMIPLELQYDSRSPTDFWSIAVLLNEATLLDWNVFLMGVQT